MSQLDNESGVKAPEENANIIRIEDEIGPFKKMKEIELRHNVSNTILPLFVKANLFVLIFVAACLAIDFISTAVLGNMNHKPIIDSTVVMSLVGATTIQLGALAIAMGKFVFEKRED